MNLYKILHDVDVTYESKITKKNTRMIRIDFGKYDKYPNSKDGESRVYHTCMGIFFNPKSIYISTYKQIFFKPRMKLPKDNTELPKYLHEKEQKPWISRVSFGNDRLVLSPTKNNKFRILRHQKINKKSNWAKKHCPNGHQTHVYFKGNKSRDFEIQSLIRTYIQSVFSSKYDNRTVSGEEYVKQAGVIDMLVSNVMREINKYIKLKKWNCEPLETHKLTKNPCVDLPF